MSPLQWVYSDIAAERRQVSLRMLFSAVHFLIYKKRQSNFTGGYGGRDHRVLGKVE